MDTGQGQGHKSLLRNWHQGEDMSCCTGGQWEEAQESYSLDLNIVSVSCSLCDLGQVAQSLSASISSSVKWAAYYLLQSMVIRIKCTKVCEIMACGRHVHSLFPTFLARFSPSFLTPRAFRETFFSSSFRVSQ